MAQNAVCVWDFTIPMERITADELKEKIKEVAKSWCFQGEQGENTGYKHWQGRISLKVKSRKGPSLVEGTHWSITSGENKDNTFYMMKSETRIEGPYSDKDVERYIPRQYRNIKLYQWQEKIKESANFFEPRKINLIYDKAGNNGKSTIASICELLYDGIDCPPLNDFKELIALVCDICMDRNTRDPKIIFFDLPRALDKDRLNGMYSAIEQIKKGKLYDCRYKYKCWWIDAPQCWVFSNILPNKALLSADRWNIWEINKENQTLIPWVEQMTETEIIYKDN